MAAHRRAKKAHCTSGPGVLPLQVCCHNCSRRRPSPQPPRLTNWDQFACAAGLLKACSCGERREKCQISEGGGLQEVPAEVACVEDGAHLCRLYEDLWREAVSELVDHLEAEHPEQKGAAPKASWQLGLGRVAAAGRLAAIRHAHLGVAGLPAPQTLEDWARIYIRYLQTLRKLDEAHAGVVQPQKRRAVRGALDACLGRVLELRAWLVLLNKDVDVVDLEAFLENLGLTPEALELPVPVYFRRERAQQLEARQAAIAAAAASGLPAGEAAAAEAVSDSEGSSSEDELQHQPEPLAEAPAVAAAPAARAQAATAPLAVAITLEEQQLQNEAASRRIQAGARGWLARRRVRAERQAELELLGMAPAAGTPAVAQLRGRLAAIREERAARQVQRQAEYEVALVSVKEKVRRQEGYGMREKIQDQVRCPTALLHCAYGCQAASTARMSSRGAAVWGWGWGTQQRAG